jgi:uncharacterized protein
MNTHTLDIAWAMNPWLGPGQRSAELLQHRLPQQFMERQLLRRADNRWDMEHKAHLLVGPRQAGKTTLLWKYASERAPRVLFLSMEDQRLREWCSSPALFVRDVTTNFPSLDALFLDEVQYLDDAALFIKGVVDLKPGAPLWVTGSSSYHLRSRIRESLAGRATRSTLLPLSYAEALGEQDDDSPGASLVLARDTVTRHQVFGGYPEVWLSGAPHLLLEDLVEAFLHRDASDYFRIRRPDAMRRLLQLMAGQIGNLVNLSEWATVCGISRDTVLDYANILEDAHLIRLLPVFAGGRRAELTATPQIYFVDNGIRNAVARNFSPPDERIDRGSLIENWVFTELAKWCRPPDTLHYWRTRAGAEVDFVLSTAAGLVGVEVKAAPLKRPQLSRGARSFIQAYQPARFFVINSTLRHCESIEQVQVEWLTCQDLGQRLAPA